MLPNFYEKEEIDRLKKQIETMAKVHQVEKDKLYTQLSIEEINVGVLEGALEDLQVQLDEKIEKCNGLQIYINGLENLIINQESQTNEMDTVLGDITNIAEELDERLAEKEKELEDRLWYIKCLEIFNGQRVDENFELRQEIVRLKEKILRREKIMEDFQDSLERQREKETPTSHKTKDCDQDFCCGCETDCWNEEYPDTKNERWESFLETVRPLAQALNISEEDLKTYFEFLL